MKIFEDKYTERSFERKNLLAIPLYSKVKEEVDKAEKDIKEVEKDIKKSDLPHIPMGKNTHSKTKDGYVYNKTKINVHPSIKNDIIHNLLQERIKDMWNSLSDDVRDGVDNLIIKKSRARGIRIRGGTWVPATKTISMNISSVTPNETGHNFFHEVGHAKWSKIKKENPEKIEKFRKDMNNIRYAPTDYSLSYSNVSQKNKESERKYRMNQARGGHTVTEESERILAKNRENTEDLYHNEIHSELNAYVMGVIKPDDIISPKEYMVKFIKSYKELWDLE